MGILSWLRTRGSCRRAIDASQQGRLREAVVGFQQVLNTAETNWQAWCALGECHYALGDFHAARWAFDRCLELNPESVEAKQGRALLRGEQDHDWPRCLEELREILPLVTDAGVAEFTELDIAWAHHRQGDAPQAQRYFDAALAHMSSWEEAGVQPDAQFAGAEYCLGVLYHALKSDRDRALKHLRRAMELSPQSWFSREARTLAEKLAADENTG